jgi:hypothetical protein
MLEQLSNETGFKLLESNMTTLDGNPASKIVYLLKPDAESEIEEKYTELISFKNNVRHRIISVADVDEYNNYAPTFQKMIDSIKIN